MATKNFQFFISLEQLLTLLSGVISKFELWLILYRRGEKTELVNFALSDDSSNVKISSYDCIFISTTKPDINKIDAKELMPAKFGWVQLDIPKVEGNVLYLSDLAVKTNWYDSKEGETHENRELLKLFNKIKKELKLNLSAPVFALNVKTGGSATYKDMAYADSAKKWEEDGGELKQNGVGNVKFSTCQ